MCVCVYVRVGVYVHVGVDVYTCVCVCARMCRYTNIGITHPSRKQELELKLNLVSL